MKGEEYGRALLSNLLLDPLVYLFEGVNAVHGQFVASLPVPTVIFQRPSIYHGSFPRPK